MDFLRRSNLLDDPAARLDDAKNFGLITTVPNLFTPAVLDFGPQNRPFHCWPLHAGFSVTGDYWRLNLVTVPDTYTIPYKLKFTGRLAR